jgi:hypothetical protein
MHKSPHELLNEIQRASPQIAEAGEIAALIESFGYNDTLVRMWGFSDVFGLAEYMYERVTNHPMIAPASQPQPSLAWFEEAKSAARKLSFALPYSIPWMALLILEYLRPRSLQVSAECGGALSLSLIASLVTTGGFIQMVSRSGNFYFGLDEPFLARHSCMQLVSLGLICGIVLGVAELMLGFYFHMFAQQYLMLAFVNYLSLTLLWLLCAVLSVQGISWCIPLSFFASAVLGGLLLIFTGLSTVVLLMLWPGCAVLCSITCAVVGFKASEKKQPEKRDSARPRFGVHLISLSPFYVYGTVYFAFLFADRLAAGSAIPWVSGLSFGIDSAYKRGMDLVLFAFLVTAALVEYFSDSFLRFWSRVATEVPVARKGELITCLRRRHSQFAALILVVFVAISLAVWIIFQHFMGLVSSPTLVRTAVLGGLGYLMLSIALLENIILASINAIACASRAVVLGLLVNILTGYALSHLFGVEYAAMGLLLGSAVVLWRCHSAIREVLRNPDYHYAIA